MDLQFQVEDTIQNGVKDTIESRNDFFNLVVDTIQNGVKETKTVDDSNLEENAVEQLYRHLCVDDTVQNGVKQTSFVAYGIKGMVEDAIQNGVKDTKEMNHDRHSYHGYFKLENDIPTHIPMDQVQDVIENGVKDMKESHFYRKSRIKNVTQNGVKHCEDGDRLDGDERFEDIIQNGVRESIEEYHHRRREVVLVTNNNKIS